MTSPEILVAIVGHGLNPSLRRFIESPLDSGAWRTLVAKLETGKLTALALAAATGGALPVTEEQGDELRHRSARAMKRREAAAQCLGEIGTVLNREAIDSCVLHGAATSALDYPEADLRLYESADVLVAPAHHDDAVALLQEKGVLRVPAHERRSRRRGDVRFVAANGVNVGVHFSITPRRFGGAIQTGDLLASRIWFSPRGVRLGALGAEERLLSVCIHARFGASTSDLLAQRDVVQLVLRDDLALRRVERLASSWRVEAVLADAVRRAWGTFAVPDVVPISAWSRAYRPHRRDRWRLASHPLPMAPHGAGLLADLGGSAAASGAGS